MLNGSGDPGKISAFIDELDFLRYVDFLSRVVRFPDGCLTRTASNPTVRFASDITEVRIMNQDNAVTLIEKLAEICKDGEKGYKDAAEHAKRPDLKTFFNFESSERGRFVIELQSALTKFGKAEKKESGTVAGVLHRAWIDTKVGFGGGDKSILDSVEKGEDEAKEAYQEANLASLPIDVAEVVSRQARSVQTAHDRVKSLRDSLAA
jgi:uncharacterized protein (TIGR02284 family)